MSAKYTKTQLGELLNRRLLRLGSLCAAGGEERFVDDGKYSNKDLRGSPLQAFLVAEKTRE